MKPPSLRLVLLALLVLPFWSLAAIGVIVYVEVPLPPEDRVKALIQYLPRSARYDWIAPEILTGPAVTGVYPGSVSACWYWKERLSEDYALCLNDYRDFAPTDPFPWVTITGMEAMRDASEGLLPEYGRRASR